MDVKVLEKPDTAGWWWREGEEQPVEIYLAMGGLYERKGSRPARSGRWLPVQVPTFPKPVTYKQCLAWIKRGSDKVYAICAKDRESVDAFLTAGEQVVQLTDIEYTDNL